MSAFVNIDGDAVIRLELHVPNVGPWWADAFFEEDPEVSGAVVLNVGDRALRCTVVEGGAFGLQRRVRVVAGAGGWGTLLTPQHFHSDSGVRALVVAQSLASAAGEQLGTFAPEVDVVGVDYVRQATAASRALEDVIGARAWWVDYDGVTHVDERAEVEVSDDAYEVLDFDPLEELVALSVEDFGAIALGGQLQVNDATRVVRELRVTIDADRLEVIAWVGGDQSSRGRLVEELTRIVRHVMSERLFGRYRYRVVQPSGDRLELQIVARRDGLPDAIPLSTRPGVPGAHGVPALGSIVHVAFVEGRRTMPVVVGFEGKDEEKHTPTELTLSVDDVLRLGGPGASDPVGLAPSIDSQLDDINSALDAFAAATPGSMDAGAALQSAFKAVWGLGTPAKPSSDVGASKVVAE